jgi:hypothetical protein
LGGFVFDFNGSEWIFTIKKERRNFTGYLKALSTAIKNFILSPKSSAVSRVSAYYRLSFVSRWEFLGRGYPCTDLWQHNISCHYYTNLGFWGMPHSNRLCDRRRTRQDNFHLFYRYRLSCWMVLCTQLLFFVSSWWWVGLLLY